MYHTLRLCFIFNGGGRAEYLRKHQVFASMGKSCDYMPRKVPLYPNLIKIGNHVNISTNVSFVTHDVIHMIVNSDALQTTKKAIRNYKFREAIGCIEVGNHVFISTGCIILYDVKIGDNVIITAGSVVTKDIPSNSVVRGNPAKVVCSFQDFLLMKASNDHYPKDTNHKMGDNIDKNLYDWLWKDFYERRDPQS